LSHCAASGGEEPEALTYLGGFEGGKIAQAAFKFSY
jgi:hypothetical protein